MKEAFTLVEVLVVILIIGILFVFLAPKISTLTDKAKEAGVKTDFHSYQIAATTVLNEHSGIKTLLDEGGMEKVVDALNDQLDPAMKIDTSTIQNTNTAITNKNDPWNNRYEVNVNYYNGESNIVFTSRGSGKGISTAYLLEIPVYADEDDRFTQVGYGLKVSNDSGKTTEATYGLEKSDITEISVLLNNSEHLDNETYTDLTSTVTGGSADDKLELTKEQAEDAGWGYSINGEEVSLVSFDGTETNIIIPSKIDGKTVTIIEGEFLYPNYAAVSITIPNTVTTLKNDVFKGCESLVSVNIPNSVNSIGCNAFEGCTSLTSINIPNTVITLKDDIFKECKSLTSVNIPSSVNSIGCNAFKGCKSLTSVSIPNSVNSIGCNAFEGCESLTSVDVPSSVTTIGEQIFSGCTNLHNVTLPDNVKGSRGTPSELDGWFDGCTKLESIVIPGGTVKIGYQAFKGCKSLKTMTVPSSVQYVAGDAIECPSLSTVYYSGTLKDDSSWCILNPWGSATVIR